MKILFVIKEIEYADHVAIAYLSAIAKEDNHETFLCIMDEENLQYFLDLDDLDSELYFRFFTTDIAYEDYTVLMEPIDRERVLCFSDELWGKIDIVLAEV